jgi:hypothetical protein
MRAFVTALGLLIWTTSVGQNCFCANDSILTEIINCDKIEFDNSSRLYWSFNCDSSWLTFESPIHKRTIIFSLGDGLQDLTGRLGYIYAQEYKKRFLIQCNVISGCCTPPDFYLFDKTTGRITDSLGTIIFYSENRKLPFIISLTNNYDISILNIDKGKKYILKLQKGEIEYALEKTEETYPEYLFDEPVIKEATIYLTYYTDRLKNEKSRQTKTITIDLNKYSR